MASATAASPLIDSPWRKLLAGGGGEDQGEAKQVNENSDMMIILAALVCALICVVGLGLVARCAWFRRRISSVVGSFASASAASTSPTPPPPPPPKGGGGGVKKRVLRSIPKRIFDPEGADHVVHSLDCAICLADFVQGEEIRVLPQCGHGFHAGCVDTWLRSHSSCPSCRRRLVVVVENPVAAADRCDRCGACGADAAASSAKATTRQDGTSVDTFLP